MKKVWRYVYPFWQNVRTWQTDRQTDRQTPHKVTGQCWKRRNLFSALQFRRISYVNLLQVLFQFRRQICMLFLILQIFIGERYYVTLALSRLSSVCHLSRWCALLRGVQLFVNIFAPPQGLGQFVLKFMGKNRRGSRWSCKLNGRCMKNWRFSTNVSLYFENKPPPTPQFEPKVIRDSNPDFRSIRIRI